MRIANHPGDACERGDVFGSALGVTACNYDARGGIRAMNLADGVARLRIGGGCNGASVQYHDIGSGMIIEHFQPIGAQRTTQRSSVCFSSTAAKVFEGERRHKMEVKAGQEALSEQL